MQGLFYKGEDIKLTFTSPENISGFTKVVKFFTPFSSIKTATIEPISNYSFSAKFSATDTNDLPAGVLNVVLEFTNASGKLISKTIQTKLADAYIDGSERDSVEIDAQVIFLQNQAITVNFTTPPLVGDEITAARDTAVAAAATATTASNTAVSAKDTAVSASTSAQSANTSAQTAKTAAESANTSAQSAKTSAEAANTSAQTAKTAAESANTSAQSAKTSAESARDTAVSANSSAQTAKTAAESAQTAAETANTSAQSAKTGAETARDQAIVAKDAAELAASNSAGYKDFTSASSVAIGTGSKTFTTNKNPTQIAFAVGQRIRVVYPTTPSNYMEGVITSFSSTTLVVDVDLASGSGTFGSWNITAAGQKGADGSAGLIGGTPNYVQKLNAGGTGFIDSVIYDNGSGIGLGTTSLTGYNVRLSKNITGAATAYAVRQDGVVQSDVVTNGWGFRNFLNTQAAAFTLSTYRHFDASENSIGAGSAVTTQQGFYVANMTSANSYAFYGAIAAGSGKYNLYMQGSANNYLAGGLGIGNTNITAYGVRVSKNITGSANAYGVGVDGTIQSDVTGAAFGFRTNIATLDSAFTISELAHFRATQGTKGAASTISSQFGFYVDTTLVGATNNYGFYGNIAAGIGRWNLYMAGTADNYLAGNLGLGVTPSAKLEVSSTDLNSLFVTNPTTTGATTGSGVGFKAYNGTSVAQYGGIFLTSNSWSFGTYSANQLSINADGTGGLALRSANSAPITFFTGGDYSGISTEKMRLFADGNLALNKTSNDGYKFDVNGTGRFSGSLDISGFVSATKTGGNAFYAYDESGRGVELVAPGSNYDYVGKVGSYTNHDFRVQTGDVNALTFGPKSGGNWLSFAVSGAATFSNSATAPSFKVGTGTFDLNSGDALIDYNAGAVRLRTFKVGVGYITPLLIDSQTGIPFFGSSVTAPSFTALGSNANNNTENSVVQLFDANSNLMGKIVGYRGANGNEGNLRFYTYNASQTLALSLSNTGNVTVGGTLGLYKFTTVVNSGVNFGVGITNLGGTNNAVFLSAVNDSYTPVPMAMNASVMTFATGFTESFRIDASQRVLIGTTSGSYILTVNGQPGANGYTAFANYSDARLKENVKDFERGGLITNFMRLRPVTFNYNERSGYDEATRSRTIGGFIAQELKEIFPEMVGTMELEGEEFYDTNLSNLPLYTVAVVQELMKTVQSLQSEIQVLKNKLN